MLLPFIFMVSLSLKPPTEIFSSSFSLLPHHWYAIENYMQAITAAALPRYLANGVIVCTIILGLQIVTGVPLAYALAKLRFVGRGFVFALVLIGVLLPHQVLSLPLFALAYQLGVLNSYTALIFPYAVSPFGIFLFRQVFMTIPDDIVDAARLDGLSEWAIVWKIVLPMALPAVIAFSIFSVVLHWNDLFWPLIVIKSPALMPPALGVAAFRNAESGADLGPLMAGAVLVVAPLLIAFLAAQRWFIEGLATSSLK
jgi:multiple sugar transport system permease protein